MSKRAAVYRLYSADNTLLYVGVAEQFGVRWEQHSKLQPWWDHVDHQAVQWYPDRGEAETAEKQAIREEKPVYNVAGSPWEGRRLHDGTGFYVVPKSPKPKSRNFRVASPRTPPSEADEERWHLAAIGGRVDDYRTVVRHVLPKRAYVIIRAGVRDRAAFLRDSEVPDGAAFTRAMDAIAEYLCAEIPHTIFGHVQPGGVDILVADSGSGYDRPWLGGSVQEMASFVASAATAEFNHAAPLSGGEQDDPVSRIVFAADVFTVPDQAEAANYFIWRQKRSKAPGRVCLPVMTKEAVIHVIKRTGRTWQAAPAEYRWEVTPAPAFNTEPGSFLASTIPPSPCLAAAAD